MKNKIKFLTVFLLLVVTTLSYSQVLDSLNLDSYNGLRLVPKSTNINGFHITKNVNQNIGFSVINTNTTGNAAQANMFVKGSGDLYTNYTGISHYNSNYYISYLRNSGLLFSDSDLYISTWNNKKIEFRTGSTFNNMIPTLTIDSVGRILIHNLPTYDGETAAELAGLSTGTLYKTSDGDIKIKL